MTTITIWISRHRIKSFILIQKYLKPDGSGLAGLTQIWIDSIRQDVSDPKIEDVQETSFLQLSIDLNLYLAIKTIWP